MSAFHCRRLAMMPLRGPLRHAARATVVPARYLVHVEFASGSHSGRAPVRPAASLLIIDSALHDELTHSVASKLRRWYFDKQTGEAMEATPGMHSWSRLIQAAGRALRAGGFTVVPSRRALNIEFSDDWAEVDLIPVVPPGDFHLTRSSSKIRPALPVPKILAPAERALAEAGS